MAQLRQGSLFAERMRLNITVSQEHELVRLSKEIDWDALIDQAVEIRAAKIKLATGPQPHYRELLGAVALMAIKQLTYRDAEDLIAHYAPARFLCGLNDTDWRIDHITIFEFTQMLGEDGIRAINTEILKIAVEKGFADPSRLMSDTTAQEAKIPYPNEVGLMSRYSKLVGRGLKRAGNAFTGARTKLKEVEKKIKALVRNSHLFAKTKEAKAKVGKKLYYVITELHQELRKALLNSGGKLRNKASRELEKLTAVMDKLLPQIKHFLDTGFVAPKKIIHLQMPDLYSIVRGKSGKPVEFGWKWGISRIGGGFLQGFLIGDGKHYSDKRFCIEAIKLHKLTFGLAPEVFGFDRGGYSRINIKRAQKLGVKHVGIAPKGKDAWAVNEKMEEVIKRERAQVEGAIGTIKRPIYGFNRADARSTAAMGRYGQRAIFGFNLRKLVREQIKLELAEA